MADYIQQLASAKREYEDSPVYIVPDEQIPRRSYTGNLQWFGSPQKYAGEIARKEYLGIPFTDPTAVKEFRRDYPQLLPPVVAKSWYGEEVPRQSWQETLDSLVRGIQLHQAQNPPYVPFAPGTPTLEKQKFDWLKTAQEAELTGTYQGKPTWPRQYQEKTLEAKQYDLSVPEYKMQAQADAVKAMQKALDKLRTEHPQGPPAEAVQNTVEESLRKIYVNLAQRGLDDETIQKAIKAVKQYAAQQSGLSADVFKTPTKVQRPPKQKKGWLQKLKEEFIQAQSQTPSPQDINHYINQDLNLP